MPSLRDLIDDLVGRIAALDKQHAVDHAEECGARKALEARVVILEARAKSPLANKWLIWLAIVLGTTLAALIGQQPILTPPKLPAVESK